MQQIVTILSFVAALMVIVTIHELGHLLVGRLCGIRAQVFSIGFGRVLAQRVDRYGTRWQIAALPLGGYVRFEGDENAASVNRAGAMPGSMNAAPIWARSLTILAGPVANFVLSIVIFAGLAISSGRVSTPLRVEAPIALPASYGAALQPGDEILALAGTPVATMGDYFLAAQQLEGAQQEYRLRRGGEVLTQMGPHPRLALVGALTPRSAAYEAGIKRGDVVVAINGMDVWSYSQIQQIVTETEGAPLHITLWRAGAEVELTVTPKRTDLPLNEGGFETRYLIGISSGWPFTPATDPVGLWDALNHGVERLGSVLSGSVSGMWHLVVGAISACNLSSPVGIAQTSGAMASQGWMAYLGFVGFLSAAIGFLNLLPIPVLDGGHLVFHLYEAVSGRAPSARVMGVALAIGVAVLFSMMLIALANDLFLCP